MEIIRKNELLEILDVVRMKPYGKFLITGTQGSGKSFLLNVIGNILENNGKRIVSENIFLKQKNEKIWESSIQDNDVCLVDDLDEKYGYHQIVEHMKNSKRCYICTAKTNQFGRVFDYTIELKPLTESQTLMLIKDYLGTQLSRESIIEDVSKLINGQMLMPRMLVQILHKRIVKEGLDQYFLDIEQNVHQVYTYSEGISLQHPEIVAPKQKIIRVPNEFKNVIKVVTDSLVDKVALRSEILQDITSRQFEELVCELFERKGYNVQLTKQTRDGGKDLIILNNSMLGNFVIYAECKKRAPKNPVSVGFVRQLYGTVEADRVTAGIMITNSYFTEPAKRFQQTVKNRMNLVDYSELMKQIINCT